MNYRLTPGDCVEHFNPSIIEPSVPDAIKVVDETNDYLVVYKPAPMPIHPGGRYYKNSLIEILRETGRENLMVLHRLDAVTSGLLLLGKRGEWTRTMAACFRNGQIEKLYYALVEGVPAKRSVRIDLPIRRKRGFIFECAEGDKSKKAETYFTVVKQVGKRSVIACRPLTGRTHQIRLHLQSWGYPVVGDNIYPGITELPVENPIQRSPIALVSAGITAPEFGIHYKLPIPLSWYDKSKTDTLSLI